MAKRKQGGAGSGQGMSIVRGVGVGAVAAVGTSVPGDLYPSAAAACGVSALVGWGVGLHAQAMTGMAYGAATLAWWAAPAFVPLPALGAAAGESIGDGWSPPTISSAVSLSEGFSVGLGVALGGDLAFDEIVAIGSQPVAGAA